MMSEEDELMTYLILQGAMEVAGMDSETGELLYAFTPKIKEIMPELYDAHMSSVNAEIMSLWQRGYIDINFMEENPVITLTEKALEEEEVNRLSYEDKWSLDEIKRLAKKRHGQ